MVAVRRNNWGTWGGLGDDPWPLGIATGQYPQLGIASGSGADSIMADAVILNDLARTQTRASSAYDPYNRVTVSANAARRRPFAVGRYVANSDLIEGARINVALRSQEFANATWFKSGCTFPTFTTAPDGTATALKLTEDNTTTDHLCVQTITKAASAITYSFSIYLKAAERSIVRCFLYNAAGTGGLAYDYDLTNLTVTRKVAAVTQGSYVVIEAHIEDAGNSWRRCVITCTSDTDTAIKPDFRPLLAVGGTSSYLGDSVSGVYAWGAQLEAMPAGSTFGFASSYIATTTVAVTRAADTLTVPYVLGQTGTVLAIGTPCGWSNWQDGTSFYRMWQANDTNTSFFLGNTVNNGGTFRRCDAGGAENASFASSSAGNQTMGAPYHGGGTWNASGVSAYVNGVLQATDATLTPPYNANTLVQIGSDGGNPYFGHVAVIAWSRVLTAAELLTLSLASSI